MHERLDDALEVVEEGRVGESGTADVHETGRSRAQRRGREGAVGVEEGRPTGTAGRLDLVDALDDRGAELLDALVHLVKLAVDLEGAVATERVALDEDRLEAGRDRVDEALEVGLALVARRQELGLDPRASRSGPK